MFKKLNERSKKEQLFVLVLLCVGMFAILCLSGCGGKSCEKVEYGSEEVSGVKMTGCSIPGIGGCLSSGRGCSSACWPQSCKFISASADDGADADNLVACDIRYYGNGCLGCGQTEDSYYFGCMDYNIGEDDINGCFLGNTRKDSEKFIGCGSGCVGTGGTGLYSIQRTEEIVGVD